MFSNEEMARHALEDFDPEFASKVHEGDVIIAGKNFGCGSSREQAVTCLKYAGVGAVVAASYARLYYRNAINQALYVIECPEASDYARAHGKEVSGSEATLDPEKGKMTLGGREFTFPPMTGKAKEIFAAGGLAEYTRKKLGQR